MRRFRPTLWASVLAAAGIAATLALGNWQLGRARDKLDLAQQQERRAALPALQVGAFDANTHFGELEMRTIEARGRFEPNAMVLLDNRVRRGVVGYEVVMPLKVEGLTERVLVNRGWIAGETDRRRLPEVVTPSEDVRVSGRAVVPGKRIFELQPDVGEGRVWQNLTIDRYRERIKTPVLPFVIEQMSDIDDGLLREWPKADRGIDTHRSYAVQWFGIAALVAVFYVALSFRSDAAQS